MKKFCSILLIALVLHSCETKPKRLIDYVDPMIGTAGTGHTYPGAALPFGMVQLSPDTKISGWEVCSGYHYDHDSIYGFSHTHLNGTGCEDYCDILVVPTTGEIVWDSKDYKSNFRRATEKASPGYYTVTLDRFNVQCELTASLRVGMHRYTFPNNSVANNILFDLKHRGTLLKSGLELISDREIAGYRHVSQWASDRRVYFVAQFSEPFNHAEVQDSTKVAMTFNGETILVKVGLSSVSTENARENLNAEMPHWDFEAVREHAEFAWERELAKIIVEGGTEAEKINFYTALYRTALAPNIYMDVNGEYSGRFGKVGRALDFDKYTLFSLWDTYRTAHPLYTIINTKRNVDFINSMLRLYDEGGLLPVWELWGNETFCMIGHHSVSVIVDAYMKGDRNFDVKKAYNASRTSADTSLFGLQYFIQNGYVPQDRESESVSKTLEYAYNAWCIAQMAKATGNMGDYREYIERAQYYKNLYDPSTGFMRAKVNSTWYSPFDPYEVNNNYTEANSWQYSFYAPHDIEGLAKLHGGRVALISKIDEMFATPNKMTGRTQLDITGLIGQYAHGNEPSHHVPYLYNYLGEPWKTQMWVRRIMDEFYLPIPDGLCGNEDCGQMSAWYIMSAMGFYPIAPGSNHYAIGTPLFKKMTINLENGKKFVITADNQPTKKNFYVQSAKLNGENYTKSYITHADIMEGGELSFVLGSKPNYNWGVGVGNEPVSEITEYLIVPVPTLSQGRRVFKDVDTIMFNHSENADIFYTLDGTMPTEQSTKYDGKPIIIKNTAMLRAIATRDGQTSKEIEALFSKIREGWSVKLEHPYSRQYTASGPYALIDGIKGEMDFRTGTWQGFYGVDLVATLDMGKVQQVNEVSIGFLQASYSWIFFPPKVTFYISNDGENFTEVGYEKTPVDPNLREKIIHRFKTKVGKPARYIKIVGDNFGVCPDWHVGAGGRTFLFVDEIEVK
ncbi:MAG: GH92 family glycosyl hydrolase [Bacteroidales bacterium]|jgi:predicted alpha-1,2-mannosidase|nr:GH92 family glycosyl hydrolase [Bacteroidales bacterium]